MKAVLRDVMMAGRSAAHSAVSLVGLLVARTVE